MNVSLAAIEIAFHLVEKSLLMLGQWHSAPP
jgi:hypothetical protein